MSVRAFYLLGDAPTMSGYEIIEVDTGKTSMTDITSKVRECIRKSGVRDGICGSDGR